MNKLMTIVVLCCLAATTAAIIKIDAASIRLPAASLVEKQLNVIVPPGEVGNREEEALEICRLLINVYAAC